jgi:hypothetical protein
MGDKGEQNVLLVRDKNELKQKISERLQNASAFLSRTISNSKQKEEWWSEFLDWDYYNLEMIKQAFDKPNNSYSEEYKRHIGGLGIIFSGDYERPSFKETVESDRQEMQIQVKKLKRFHDKIELLKVEDNLIKTDNRKEKFEQLLNLLTKFHKVAQELRDRRQNRKTLTVTNEYDVQDLLRALLHLHFTDIRREESSPSSSGANSRLDFVLKNEKIILEVKMSNSRLKAKEIGEALLIDIGRYKEYPDCSDLVIFIYDKGDYIRNKGGLITDLQKQSTINFTITVVISPE